MEKEKEIEKTKKVLKEVGYTVWIAKSGKGAMLIKEIPKKEIHKVTYISASAIEQITKLGFEFVGVMYEPILGQLNVAFETVSE